MHTVQCTLALVTVEKGTACGAAVGSLILSEDTDAVV